MRRLNKLLIVSFVLLLTIAFVPNATSQQFPEYEQEWFWSIPVYAPAKVNINYVYTNNNTIRDISCLGTTSDYHYSGGPTSMLFEPVDLDTYRYTLELIYDNVTLEHLTVGIWSGTQQVQPVLEYSFYTMHLIIHITLQVTKEPVYPTAEETAEATLALFQTTWENYTKALEERINMLEETLWIHDLAMIVVIVIAAIALIVSLTFKRK